MPKCSHDVDYLERGKASGLQKEVSAHNTPREQFCLPRDSGKSLKSVREHCHLKKVSGRTQTNAFHALHIMTLRNLESPSSFWFMLPQRPAIHKYLLPSILYQAKSPKLCWMKTHIYGTITLVLFSSNILVTQPTVYLSFPNNCSK